METDMRKSVPVVREFQIEGSWAPATPVKPILPRPTRIYTDGVETGLGPTHFFDSDKYLSTSLSMNMSTPGENVRTQCQSTEILSPHWRDSYGFANVATSSVGFGGLGLQSWVSRDPIVNVSAKGENSSDPLEQRNNMSFQHLLAMKGPPLEPLMNGALMNNNGSYSLANGYCSSGWSSEVENGRIDGSSRSLLFGDREVFHGLDQEINGRSVQERKMHTGEYHQLGGFPHTYWNSCDLSSLTGREYAFPNGIKSKIAPPTPDQYRKVCNKIASSTSSLCTDHVPDGQNKDHENEVAAAMVDLQELQCNKETQEVEENHNPDKGGSHIIDLNKTPQQKPRRRKYQPKVVREDKPKRTPKPKTPKNTENPRAKRKYVRKNKETPPSTNSPPEVAETNDPKVQEEAAKSCKRALDFDLENPAEADNGLNDSNSEPQAENSDSSNIQTGTDLQLREGKQVDLEATQVGINGLVDTQSVLSVGNKKAEAEYEGNGKGDNEAQTGVAENNTEKTFEMGTNGVTCSQSCDINGSSNMVEQTKGSKRSYSCVETANLDNTHCTFWQPKHMFLGNLNINGISSILFPEIYKKKRTEKGQRSYTSVASSSAVSEDIDKVTHLQNPAMSKYYYCNPPQFNTFLAPNVQAKSVDSSNETRNQLLQTWADIARIKKKRSKGPTRVRNLSPLKGIAEDPVKRKRKYTRKQNAHTSDRTDSCMEFPLVDTSNGTDSCKGSLVVDTRTIPKTKKRSKKRSNVASSLDLVLYNSNQSSRNSGGALLALPWEEKVSIDMIIEKLIQLDINREGTPVSERALIPYHGKGQNALVVYGKDGTMVPFEGPFDPVKKRRPRAKVDLDGETERVWKLLLQSIDNQGIDGTDEEKAKWWEEERRVFRGRVDSFIARMRLVQGDRRFTPWKGSVLDSVIGVFLTQNVSDHLSSSAFMSMAAHFPVKSESEPTMFSEVPDILVEEPDVYITEPQERITWNKKVMDQQNCDGNSWKLHDVEDSEVKEAQNRTDLIGVSDVICKGDNGDKLLSESRMVRSSTYITEMESAINLGDDIAREDATSSQHSVLSSQNSVDSPSTQTAERMRAHSESNSEAEDLSNSSKPTYLDYSTSFVELLKIQETPLLHETYSGNNTWSYQMFESNPPETNAPKTSLEGQDISLIHSQLHLTTDFQLQDGKCADILEEGSRSSDTSMRKDKNSATELSDLTTESTVQCSAQEKILESTVRSPTVDMCSFYVLDGERMVMQTEKQPFKEQDTAASPVQGQSSSVWKNTNLSHFSQETADFTESTSTSKGGIASECKELKQIPESTKPTKGKGAKDKQPAFDWDSLRKEAQRNGRKERTTNAMDSVDWEAVRCADVSQIADTIKERGMNNVLAGRIKDALNRLAREHGSVDLEWLRDIPPDKAKEYLLSIRGLGLKSVECIRLLTLHHLAFPVDTNVGRIAVRLGWVPLQPLPESLQLHLLEMYPVLESIQKYLWPRLCKLDQRTLYELHYHMITFGKVFCTKRQPNCNACPLRGECRHFASAFASARLALPGPEERSIMPSTQGIPTHQHPPVTINPLPLPPAPANQFSEMNSSINISDHIMGIQLSASSLPSLHGNLHSETKSEVRSSEPIIEVPASPEPEHSQTLEQDIEDAFYEDPNEIPTIKLNIEEFTQTLQNYMQGNMELQEGGMSRALVALTPEVASIPTPRLKNVNRLRTEHHVYELPDKHPLLHGLEKRESDDPCPYLLAIWTPGETANSIQPPERRCIAQDSGILCTEETCFYCNSQREANFQIVRGTLLIPCRTAMRGSFPLNGTYFQVNEVFADHDSSLNPIDVPREWLWNLPRRTVYFGTSIPTIFRGLTTDEIQHCFWRGFVCVRGFERKTRAPRPLMARLHFPASRMPRNRGKTNGPPEATM